MKTTRNSPHETREANAMHSRLNIDVQHYQLDDKGRPMKVTEFPNAIEGALLDYVLYSYH